MAEGVTRIDYAAQMPSLARSGGSLRPALWQRRRHIGENFASHDDASIHRQGATMQIRVSRSPDCAVGLHAPRSRHRDVANQHVQRSACRRCGAAIVKSAVSRRWIVSGVLG
ncbi:hypothetical protein [Sphingomonas sp. M1A8_2b]